MAEHDVFLSHASEDKATVARPLAEALRARGWTVWVDETELTIGDSLHRQIDEALAKVEFGIVILSPAFLAKEWTQRELAALAAREIDSGAKVILPVWHEIDHARLAAVSPLMADRLGALTSAGLDDVAERISVALRKARAGGSRASRALVQPIDADADDRSPLALPVTPDARAAVIATRPRFWEYVLFAGHLKAGGDALEPKWYDHEHRLGRGVRRVWTRDSFSEALSSEMSWVGRQVEALERVMDPVSVEQAFGAPGQHGDPQRIEYLAQSILRTYEALLDWAASLRNVSAPSFLDELIEASAAFCDGPITGARTFIVDTACQISAIPEALASSGGQRVVLDLDLDVGPLDGASARIDKASKRVAKELRRRR